MEENNVKCDYCGNEILGLKQDFYCPPDYKLKTFCQKTKENDCAKQWSDERYAKEKMKEVLDTFKKQ